MKSSIATIFAVVAVTMLFTSSAFAGADTLTSTIRVMNTVKATDTTYTFEVWFKNTSSDSVEYAMGQYFWDINPTFLNGPASVSILSSGFPTNFIPRNPTVYTASTPAQLRFATNPDPGADFGYWIHANDSVLVMKVRLKCRTGFSTAPMNMALRRASTAGVGITYYIGTENTNVTNYCTLIDEFPITPTSVSPVTKKVIPNVFAMNQNYPNPFNPTSNLSYQLPVDSRVTLKVYDLTGREVATLVNGEKPAGFYTVNFNAASLASGVYIYRMSAEGKDKASSFQSVKKMLLLK